MDEVQTLSAEALAHIATLSFEPRPDYGPGVEAAWSNTLDSIVDWECESSICNPEDEDEDGESHGWPKWQRIERGPDGLIASIECGHCGSITMLITDERTDR